MPARERDPEDPRRARTASLSLALFLFAAILLFPPLLKLFEGGGTLFGLPTLYLFLFAVWIVVVAAVYLIAEHVAGPRRGPN